MVAAEDRPLSQDLVDILDLPGLNLEVYAEPRLVEDARALLEPLARVWTQFVPVAEVEGIFASRRLSLKRQPLNVELTWADNEMIRALNGEYRQKDQATDVLSFPLQSFSDGADGDAERQVWISMPQLPLGNIFISIEYAQAAVSALPQPASRERYLLERFVHGMLHLLGMHHDTMPDFERVVEIQKRVLDAALGVDSAL